MKIYWYGSLFGLICLLCLFLLGSGSAQVDVIIPTPVPATLTPSPTPTPVYDYLGYEIIPTPVPPPPTMVNDLPYTDFIVMPPEVISHIREIYAAGQKVDRDPHVFTRLGDSIIEYPVFLTRFDSGDYNLGDYDYLQRVIDYYAGSFDHQSVAVRRGLHTWSVFDPLWARKDMCFSGEHMLECEFRRMNPSIIFIRIGTNDKGVPEMTEANLREIVQYCLDSGVIPIMGTKADRFDGADDINNKIIREVAAGFAVPLWDFDLVASTVPGRGLDIDNVHLTAFFAQDWRLERGFTSGHGLHNLTALIALDEVWQVLQDGE